MNNIFNKEELNLICIFDIESRDNLLIDLKNSLPDIYHPELISIVKTCIKKLQHMSNKEYDEVKTYIKSII